MIRIPVKLEKPYEVLVERGVLIFTVPHIKYLLPPPKKILLVSDQNVHPLHGVHLERSLRETWFDFHLHRFVTPAGEAAKGLDSYGQLLRAMARIRLNRGDLVIALGGGVIGDLAGFAAATYLRGMRWVQIPTTLLAMIDASVGGKTALNLPEGKNLVGAFHQPSLVLCNPALLGTLPVEEIKNGMGELIKTALLDRELWEDLEKWDEPLPNDALIARAIRLKASLVAADERDYGSRRLLNLGHSFGHAIEAASGYTIPHGQAVAMGLQMVTRAAAKRGYCASSLPDRLKALLVRHGLERENPFDKETLLPFIRRDKKASGEYLTLIVPHDVGRVEPLTVYWEDLPNWIP